MTGITFRDLLGTKTLIVGEAGSGKTLILAGFLEEAIAQGLADKITLIDLAPPRHDDIGGKVSDYTSATAMVNYLTNDNISAPRLTGRSRLDVLQLAEQNMKIAEAMFARYERSLTQILMMNDLTIYLQSGNLEYLLSCIGRAATFLGTAYRGERLNDDKASGISEREKRLVEQLVKKVDKLIEFPFAKEATA